MVMFEVAKEALPPPWLAAAYFWVAAA